MAEKSRKQKRDGVSHKEQHVLVCERVRRQAEEETLDITSSDERHEMQDAGPLHVATTTYPEGPHTPTVAALSASFSQQSVSIDHVNVGGSNNTSFIAGSITGNNFFFNADFKEGSSSRGQDVLAENTAADCCAEELRTTYKTTEGSSSGGRDVLAETTAADCCAEELRTTYKTTGSYMKMNPWIDDDAKHITDIYTQLLLETEEGILVSKKNSRKLKSYGEIFQLKTKEGDPIKMVVLNGITGRGKSTLVNKMAYDWAVYVQVLAGYKLVFVLQMHALEQSSDLIDAVFDQLLPEDTHTDRWALKLFVSNNPNKVLILMDGFDELKTTSLSESSFGSILKILSRKMLRGCQVVVTTRPSHYDTLVTRSLVQKPFTHVRVSGFSAEDIGSYVSRFYAKERITAMGLLQRIRSSDVLSDLAKSPMLLLLMCLLWREYSELPDTTSRLYGEIIEFIFKRKADLSDEVISEIVVKIGEIALRGLVSGLSFEEGDVEENVLNMAVKAGLLTKERVLKGLGTRISVQFIHKTFQEFCAAKYLQHLSNTDTEKFQSILSSLVSTSLFSFDQLLRFCCGDNEKCLDAILKMFQENLCFGGRLRKLALSCYFEAQPENVPSVEFMHSVITEELFLVVWDSDCLNSLTYFLKHVTDRTDDGPVYLAKVRKLRLLRCNLERYGTDLARSMRAMTNVSTVDLIDCSLTSKNVEDIASSMHSAILTKLNLSYNETLGGSAKLWSSWLQHLKQLRKLEMSECSLTGEDGKHLVKSLCDLPNFTDLDVSFNTSLGRSAKVWCCHLKHLKCLQTLSLVGCNMNRSQCIKCLAQSIGSMTSLVNCLVSFDSEQMETVRLIELTQGGIRLDLSKCSFSDRVQADIFGAISRRGDLVEVVIDGNTVMTSALYRHFKDSQTLRRLKLDACDFVSDDVKRLLLSLARMKNLLDCSITSVYETDTVHLIEQTQSGIKLDLSRCLLSGKDEADVLKAMSSSHRSNVVEVSIVGSKVMQSVLYFHLRQFNNLRKLRLYDCEFERGDLKCLILTLGCTENFVDCSVKFTYEEDTTYLIEQTDTGIRMNLSDFSFGGKDVSDVLQAVKDRSDLVELVLSGNTLGNAANLWCSNLRHLKNLQKLDVSSCSLFCEDVVQTIEELHYVPNFLEVNLSFNQALSGSATVWCPLLRCLTRLRTLRLVGCNLKGPDFRSLTLSISYMENLVTCSVGCAYMVKSIHLIEQISTGVRCDLSKCSFTGQDLADALQAMSHRDDLVELVLSGKTPVDPTALWSHLEHLRELQRLDLSPCCRTVEDETEIKKSLRTLTNLVEFSIAHDEQVGGLALWYPHLRHLKHLEMLDLSHCRWEGSGVQDVYTAVRDLIKMVELYCSLNEPLGETAVLWCPPLEQLKHLQKLDLSHCLLTETHMARIVRSICELADLVELDLSFNPKLRWTTGSWSPYMLHLKCPLLKYPKLQGCCFSRSDYRSILCSNHNIIQTAWQDSLSDPPDEEQYRIYDLIRNSLLTSPTIMPT